MARRLHDPEPELPVDQRQQIMALCARPVAPSGPRAVEPVMGTSSSKSRPSDGTITLKTTDTTLVSVDHDGANDHSGALVHLSHDSPGTIAEETPSATGATVTPTQSHGRGKARPRL